MSASDAGVEIVKALLPPQNPNNEEEQQRWRWVVFASIVSLGCALAAHVAMACGLVPFLFPGFAPSTALNTISRRVDIIATSSIELSIRGKLSERCSLPSGSNTQEATIRRDLNTDIDRLEREYHSINGMWFPQPSCGDL